MTVMTLSESDILRTGAVTRPKTEAPDDVVATSDAAEHPPNLSHAIT